MTIELMQIIIFIIGMVIGKIFLRFPFINEDVSEDLVTKKDYFYWITGLCIFIILWISTDLYKDKDFSQYLSFAGTVTSILLGLVAIVYSYFQNYDSARSRDSLENTSKKLDDITVSLESSVREVKDLSENLNTINELVNILSKKVGELNEELADLKHNMNSKLNETNSILRESSLQQIQGRTWENPQKEYRYSAASAAEAVRRESNKEIKRQEVERRGLK